MKSTVQRFNKIFHNRRIFEVLRITLCLQEANSSNQHRQSHHFEWVFLSYQYYLQEWDLMKFRWRKTITFSKLPPLKFAVDIASGVVPLFVTILTFAPFSSSNWATTSFPTLRRLFFPNIDEFPRVNLMYINITFICSQMKWCISLIILCIHICTSAY